MPPELREKLQIEAEKRGIPLHQELLKRLENSLAGEGRWITKDDLDKTTTRLIQAMRKNMTWGSRQQATLIDADEKPPWPGTKKKKRKKKTKKK